MTDMPPAASTPTDPKPSVMELWHQAGGGTPGFDRAQFLDLMREHGHILPRGGPEWLTGS